jgi:hypothetical protein
LERFLKLVSGLQQLRGKILSPKELAQRATVLPIAEASMRFQEISVKVG